MRERKYVKIRVDMYEDTKLKIIDRRPERDLIHYVWNRLVLLAGKVNLEGALYFSKTRPYAIETLAIEFNRGASEIKLAMDVLIELEMVDFDEAKIYRVTNFAKHQNIKTKEKVEVKDSDHDKEIKTDETPTNENEVEKAKNDPAFGLEVTESTYNVSQNNAPIPFEAPKNKGVKKKSKQYTLPEIEEIGSDEEPEDDPSNGVFEWDGQERPLVKGETVVDKWYF
jgi:predicted phage replisome organizer